MGVGLANLDDDPQLDIWLVSETGQIVHAVDDTEIDSLVRELGISPRLAKVVLSRNIGNVSDIKAFLNPY